MSQLRSSGFLGEEKGVHSVSYKHCDLKIMSQSEGNSEYSNELNVSFGYQCNANQERSPVSMSRNSSFSCLSGAALSANLTLANTNLCNGLIGEEILPCLDSPKSFMRVASSPSLSRLDLSVSPSQSIVSILGGSVSGSVSSDSDTLEMNRNYWKPMSAPTRVESPIIVRGFDVEIAGGAAGEDRVQAVCSEENGWLFCGVYDGFNGRDAADFLAGTLYGSIALKLETLERRIHQQRRKCSNLNQVHPFKYSPSCSESALSSMSMGTIDVEDINGGMFVDTLDKEFSIAESTFRRSALDCLVEAIAQAESDFLYMVEQEMEDRPDLVSIGACVLIALLHGSDIYILNLGDSRAVVATRNYNCGNMIRAVQLTETHTVDNELERRKILCDHPDETSVITGGRVKGKLRLTRAFGVGYLKESKFNDAIMGILRVRNLCSPPYIYAHPFTTSHIVTESDLFVILGSDGLFDFFSNDEVVGVVHQFIQDNPYGDPAKHLIKLLVLKAAENAGFTTDELMRIPLGRRRKYHDDVTVIVIILGKKQRTTKASISL